MLDRYALDEKMYSAYMFDAQDGWCAVHRLPLKVAIRYCKEYKRDWSSQTLVALVPDGFDPKPYFQLALAYSS